MLRTPFTSWREAMQQVSADIDGEFGEVLTFIPCRKPTDAMGKPLPGGVNLQSVPIGPQYVLTGVFRYRSEIGFQTHGKGGLSAGVESRKPIAEFAIATLLTLPAAPQIGDQIVRGAGGNRFQVRDVLSDGVSRVSLHLNIMGPQDLLR